MLSTISGVGWAVGKIQGRIRRCVDLIVDQLKWSDTVNLVLSVSGSRIKMAFCSRLVVQEGIGPSTLMLQPCCSSNSNHVGTMRRLVIDSNRVG